MAVSRDKIFRDALELEQSDPLGHRSSAPTRWLTAGSGSTPRPPTRRRPRASGTPSAIRAPPRCSLTSWILRSRE